MRERVATHIQHAGVPFLYSVTTGSCECCPLDLESLESVRAFAASQQKEMQRKKQSLAVLVNNGGVPPGLLGLIYCIVLTGKCDWKNQMAVRKDSVAVRALLCSKLVRTVKVKFLRVAPCSLTDKSFLAFTTTPGVMGVGNAADAQPGALQDRHMKINHLGGFLL